MTAHLQQLLAELGVGGSLVFGLPLIVIGLAMRGLGRRQLHRLVEARRHRRRITDVTEGPVAIAGVARGPRAGFFSVEDEGTRVVVGPIDDVLPKDGEPVLVFGAASASGGGTTDYAQRRAGAGRSIRVTEDGLVLVGAHSIGDRIFRMRLQTSSARWCSRPGSSSSPPPPSSPSARPRSLGSIDPGSLRAPLVISSGCAGTRIAHSRAHDPPSHAAVPGRPRRLQRACVHAHEQRGRQPPTTGSSATFVRTKRATRAAIR